MSAISTIKKYIILAVSGAVIIGIGTFFLLDSYFERVEIVVAKKDVPAGHVLEESDTEYREYFRDSLPSGYFEKKNEVTGKKISCERKTGDPVTASVFEKVSGTSMIEELGPGEVLMALNISYIEPLIGELAAGSRISIISTEREKSIGFSQGINATSGDEKINGSKYIASDDRAAYQDYSIISPDIVLIDGHIIIKNLEIVDIKIPEIKEENLLTGSKKDNPYIFIKCSINEAPVISRITKEDKYKIFMERI